MNKNISITSLASVSALGSQLVDIWHHYQNDQHYLNIKNFKEFTAWVGQIPFNDTQQIEKLRLSDSKYKNLDNTVLYALYVARKAVKESAWDKADIFGINIGSSRGATSLFEKYHKEYLQTGKCSTLSSPTTTLGNISSWLACDLQAKGPEISHSITCSTGLHSVLNGIAWLQSGMLNKFLVGASEAALTAFSIRQMQALKIYANNNTDSYPCKSLKLNKNNNSLVLGEAASVACIEAGKKQNALAYIVGMGYATEVLKHNTSLSTNANCFQRSMQMALKNIPADEINIVIMHAPGTVKGDLYELNAIKKIFGKQLPFLITNKWKLGHTFASSGMLNLELAILMLLYQKVVPMPFITSQNQPKKIDKVLINAVGFGGNAVSLVIAKN
ncbi:MAG: beta-ketoacyl synthase N-terminal-like domain-containing protein [Tenacibaculum sp.]